MMKSKFQIVYAIIGVLIVQSGFTQQVQLPLFGQYRENQSILNPAALNIDYILNGYNLSMGVSYRNQWGAADLLLDNGKTEHFGPRTLTARAEWIIPESRLLLGAHFINDDAAALSLQGAYFRVGYFVLDPRKTDGIGLVGSIGGGFNSFRSDLNQAGITDYNTQYTFLGDVPDFKLRYWDINMGLFGWGEVQSGVLDGDILYGGISIPQFQGLPLDDIGATASSNGSEVQEDYVQINVVAGIYKVIGGDFIEASLNFTHLLKSKAPKVITPNVRWHYNDIAWFGAGARFPVYRREDDQARSFDDLVSLRELSYYRASSILIDVGFNIGKNLSSSLDGQNIKVGIGYEIPLGQLLRNLGNTIEFNLTYTLDTGGGRR